MLGLRGLGSAGQGGVERHVEELSWRMAERGHAVTVFCRSRYNPEGDRLYRGVRLVNRPAVYSKHLEAVTHTALVMPSLLWGFDVVHIHATGPSLFAWLPRLTGRKVVVTVHGLDYRRAKWGGLASAVLKAGAWTAIHCPAATIVVSRTLQEYYRESAGKESVWIPNGVNSPPRPALDGLKRFGLEKGRYILSLGRLVPEKGLHYLIPAYMALNAEEKLVVAGGGGPEDGYERRLRALAGKDARVIFTGPLYGRDKDEAFANAKCFVLPSDLEGMPIAMLEAMSYGCPVLASDIPECLEVFSGRDSPPDAPVARFFRAGDVSDLRNALAGLLRDGDLPALGENARGFVLNAYRWDDITESTLAVYAGLTG